MRFGIKAKPTGAAVYPRWRDYGLKVLAFVFRHSSIVEPADGRMLREAARKERRSALVQPAHKYESLFLHNYRFGKGLSPKITSPRKSLELVDHHGIVGGERRIGCLQPKYGVEAALLVQFFVVSFTRNNNYQNDC